MIYDVFKEQVFKPLDSSSPLNIRRSFEARSFPFEYQFIPPTSWYIYSNIVVYIFQHRSNFECRFIPGTSRCIYIIYRGLSIPTIYTDICCSIFECRFILGTSCLNISPFLPHRGIYIPTSLQFWMSVHSGNVAVYIYYISRFIYSNICCSIFECRFIPGTSRYIYIYTYSHLNIYSFPFIISYNISFVNSLLYTELFCLFYFLGM